MDFLEIILEDFFRREGEISLAVDHKDRVDLLRTDQVCIVFRESLHPLVVAVHDALWRDAGVNRLLCAPNIQIGRAVVPLADIEARDLEIRDDITVGNGDPFALAAIGTLTGLQLHNGRIFTQIGD